MIFDRLSTAGIRRIAIFRALQLGDTLCAVPAWRALRAAFPKAEIVLIGLPWAEGFVHRFHHLVDEFLEFPGFPGLPEQEPKLSDFPLFLSRVQRMHFDLALQMQGDGTLTNSLISLFGAKLNAGFCLPGQYRPDAETFLTYPEHEPEVWRHLRLIEHLGLPLQGDNLEFPLFAEDWRALGELPASDRIQAGRYAVIHPGARERARRWPAGYFSQVADSLAQRGLEIVITGSEDERPLADAVAVQMHAPALNLAGKTRLGALGALISGARLVICNDTGISHLAAALKVPSVVLFLTSDPNRWAPLNRELHRVIHMASAATPQLVISTAEDILQKELAYAE